MVDKMKATFTGGRESVEIQRARLLFLEAVLDLRVRSKGAGSKELDAMMRDFNELAGNLIGALEAEGK